MLETLGVAFVGCAHPHLPPRCEWLAAEADVRPVRCYDPNLDLAAQTHARTGLPVFDSVDSLLDQPGVRLAVVEGWDRDNPSHEREAARRGQAVSLEKPGASNLSEFGDMARHLRDNTVPFQMAFTLSHTAAITEASRILNSGVLGAITLGRFHMPRASWRYQRANSELA